MAADPGAVRRWAAAHAATIRPVTAGIARATADAVPDGLARQPAPAVLAAVNEVRSWDAAANYVNCIAWATHPGGQLLLATTDNRGIARTWDADTGRQLHTLLGHETSLGKAEWGSARDGRPLLATSSYDGTARIWDPDTGECLRVLTGHKVADESGGVVVAWGTDPGRLPVLATAGPNRIIRTWDPSTGQELSAFSGRAPDPGFQPGFSDMAWATGADGQARLATCQYESGLLQIWNPRTGQLLHTSVADPMDDRESVAYGQRADGQLVLASADGRGGARVWTEENGGLVAQRLPAVDGITYTARWAPLTDGRTLLATATGSAVHLWDGHSLQRLHTEQVDFANAGRWRLDWTVTRGGRLLLATVGRGQVIIWEIVLDPPVRPPTAEARRSPASGRPVPRQARPARLVLPPREVTPSFQATPQIREATSVACAATPDGRTLLATTHGDRARGEKGVQVWDLESGRHLRTLTGHAGRPRDVAWAQAPDGRRLLVTAGGQDSTARIWDPETGQQLHTIAEAGTNIYAVAWGTRPDGTLLLATATSKHTVPIWDPETGQELRALAGHSNQVTGVAWGTRPDGTLLLATASLDQTVRIWNPETGVELHRLTGHDNSVYGVAWATRPDGTMLLATAGLDQTVRIWDPGTGHELVRLTGSDGESQPLAVAWAEASDGRLLIAAADNTTNSTWIWDSGTGTELASLPSAGSRQPLALMRQPLAWIRDRDGNLVIVIANPEPDSGPVRVWLVETGNGGGQPGSSPPGRPGTRGAAQAGRHLLRLGAGGLWLPLGPLADLVTLTAPGDSSRPRDSVPTRADPRTSPDDERSSGDEPPAKILLVDEAGAPEPIAVTRSFLGALTALRRTTGILVIDEAREPERIAVTRSSLDTLTPLEETILAMRLMEGGTRYTPSEIGQVHDLAGEQVRQLEREVLAKLCHSPEARLPTKEAPERDQAPGTRLHDARLAVLADEPGIGRLRDLAAGQPQWNPDARAAFAALLTAELDIPARYTPPDDADPAALAAALATAPTDGTSTVNAPWQVPVAELRAAAERITAQVITLLAILGPDACAADPLLPVRLARHVPQLPALSPRQLRFLASDSSRQPPSARTAALGALTYSPGTAGVTRSGPPSRLLPTQLALPADLLTIRLAEDQLLYRQHRAPAPPAPVPVALILDITPPTYGPAGTLLRLAAHLITTTLWAHGHHPHLITLTNPATPAQLRTPANLITIWTATTLDDPGPPLSTARHTAIALGQPTLLLTTHHTARDHGYAPGPATRLLTTHQPPEKPPPGPAAPWHAHLPPGPTHTQLTNAISQLLAPQ